MQLDNRSTIRLHYFFFFFFFLSIRTVSSIIYNCDQNAPCGCSSISTTDISSRIVGGEIVRNRAWGWTVSLQYLGAHRCGATLISDEYAVTAAHCVEDAFVVGWLSILAGTNTLTDLTGRHTQRRTITNVYIHPYYESSTYRSDIAVLRFAPLSMGINSTLSFICLPSTNEDPFSDNDHLVALGWGVLYSGSLIKSNDLRQVTVKAMATNSQHCRQAPILYPMTQFCAGIDAGGKDTCQGDSGGPLMAFQNNRWILAGITSNGNECAKPGFPGIYTRLSAFIPFIESISKGIYPPPSTRNKTNFICISSISLFLHLIIVLLLI